VLTPLIEGCTVEDTRGTPREVEPMLLLTAESLKEFGAAMIFGSAALGILRLRKLIKKAGPR
jgi:hypothetical protein